MACSAATPCNKMWDSVFINVHGDVFFCCRREPSAIGNLYQSSLGELWNGATAQSHRALALGGELGCQRNCTMLTRAEKSQSVDGWTPSAGRIRKVHIEHHEFCNIACIMCYQLEIPKRAHLSNELLFRQIDFTQVDEVQLQGGEPLAFKPCIQLFHRLIDEFHVPVTLQTNGLLITEELADKIAKNCIEIMIAMNAATEETHAIVNAGSDFKRVLQSIRMLQEAKQRHPSRLRIEGQMTIIRENVHEIAAFIRFAEEIGLDSIAVSWEQSVPEYLADRPELFQQISRELRALDLPSRRVFAKRKHLERLQTFFDLERPDSMLRQEELPLLERTGAHYPRPMESGRA